MKYYKVTIETFDAIEEAIIAFDSTGRQFGIPKDNDNMDYRAFLAWCAEGNEPEEWSAE